MKKLIKEMETYLIKGMIEEETKDEYPYTNNYMVRQHYGMWHETIKDVSKWGKCVQENDEYWADFYYRVLEDHYIYWKDYFDESPIAAHEKQDKKLKEQREEAERRIMVLTPTAADTIEMLQKLND